MGYSSQRNRPLGIGVVAKMLELVLDEAANQERFVAREYMKFGAAAALAVCASLRGNEVFLLDLAGMRRYIDVGRGGRMPEDPMKVGVDLTKAPHIIVTLIGEFKGELGTKHHLIALASETWSGIKLRWWLRRASKGPGGRGMQDWTGIWLTRRFGGTNVRVRRVVTFLSAKGTIHMP